MYLKADSEFAGPLRGIRFEGWKNKKEVGFSCVQKEGSVYFMGSPLFAREGHKQGIKHYPSLLVKGTMWIILFRVRE